MSDLIINDACISINGAMTFGPSISSNIIASTWTQTTPLFWCHQRKILVYEIKRDSFFPPNRDYFLPERSVCSACGLYSMLMAGKLKDHIHTDISAFMVLLSNLGANRLPYF